MRKKRVFQGFTLIELMIAVVIVGILAAIAYPSYQRYMLQTRRSDAQIALLNVANLQERFFTECNTYANSLTNDRTCAELGLNLTDNLSPDGHYRLTIASASATAFTVSAEPVSTSPQASDSDCTGFSIDERGNRNAAGAAASRCWRR